MTTFYFSFCEVADDYPEGVVRAIHRQAQLYARQIRGLERIGAIDADIARIRKAWQAFVDQHTDYNLWWCARSEYSAAYLGYQTEPSDPRIRGH